MSRDFDAILRLFPYGVLAIGSATAVSGIGFTFCQWEPFSVLFRGNGSALLWGFLAGLLLLNVFYGRFFCRYFCPYAPLLRVASYFSERFVSITEKGCVNCHLCQDACPVDAIIKPIPVRELPPQAQAVRRLGWVISSLPVWLLLMGGLGAGLGYLFLDGHSTIQLASELNQGLDTLDTQAFLQGGISMEQLAELVKVLRLRIPVAFVSSFVFSGFLAWLALFLDMRKRPESFYTVNTAECVCCARCYPACPKQ